MSKIALIRDQDGGVIQVWENTVPDKVELPEIGMVMGATVGWSGKGYSILAVIPSSQETPEGQTVGYSKVQVNKEGLPEEIHVFRDIIIKPQSPRPPSNTDLMAQILHLTTKVKELETRIEALESVRG